MKKLYNNNHDLAEQYFINIGAMPSREDRTEKWILHHIDPDLKTEDPIRYYEWRIEDLVPMTQAEHNTIHHTGYKYSDESKEKMSAAKEGYEPWNKGKHCPQFAGENNGMFGRKHSEGAKKAVGDKHRGRHRVYRPDGTWFMSKKEELANENS